MQTREFFTWFLAFNKTESYLEVGAIKNKKVLLIIFVAAITIYCIAAAVIFAVPSKIRDLYPSDIYDDYAISIVETSYTGALITTRYTDSKNDIEPFLIILGDLDIAMRKFSIIPLKSIEYSGTNLYEIRILYNDRATELKLSSDGKLFTERAAYIVNGSAGISKIMSLTTAW